MKKWVVLAGILAILMAGASFGRAEDSGAGGGQDDYDRLDGHGPSRKTVQVIEWEGNLEVHVMPKGSLKGLALKLDHPSKGKTVMVLGYRFADNPGKQLIRRNILGIPMNEGFKTYKDLSADDYDKIIISNNTLSDQVVAFQLDPEPKQLYPDGYDAELKSRQPAGVSPAQMDSGSAQPQQGAQTRPTDDGTIQPFFMGSRKN